MRLRGLAAGARGMTGGSWALASLVLGLAIGAVRSLVAARLIGAHEVGTFGIALLVLATVDALAASAADTALITHRGDPDADLDLTFTLRLGQGLLGALLLWVSAPLAGAFFGSATLPALIRALALVPVIRGAANPAAVLLVRRAEFRRLFWWGLPELAAATLLVVVVGRMRGDAWAPAASMIGAQVVTTAVSYALAPRMPRLVVRGPGRARLLHFGRWTQATRILMFVGLYLDNALVGKVLGATALGLYQIAFRIGEIPIGTVGRAAAQVMLPALARLRARPERLRRAYGRMLRLVVHANAALALLVVVAARPVVAALLGPAWLPAVPVAQILVVAMVLRNVMQLGSQLLYALDLPRPVFVVNAARIGVLAAVIWPLMGLWGMRGVAVAVLLSCVAAAVGSVLATRAALGAGGRLTAATARPWSAARRGA